MTDDLVERLRNPDIDRWQIVFEAADRIEALERDCWQMHEADNKLMATLETRILRLEAALREIGDLYVNPQADKHDARVIARRALDGR